MVENFPLSETIQIIVSTSEIIAFHGENSNQFVILLNQSMLHVLSQKSEGAFQGHVKNPTPLTNKPKSDGVLSDWIIRMHHEAPEW